MTAAFPLQYSRKFSSRIPTGPRGQPQHTLLEGGAAPLRGTAQVGSSAVDVLQPGGIGYAGLHKLGQIERMRSLQLRQQRADDESGRQGPGVDGSDMGRDDVSNLALRIAARLPPTTNVTAAPSAPARLPTDHGPPASSSSTAGRAGGKSLSSKELVGLQVGTLNCSLSTAHSMILMGPFEFCSDWP